LRGIQSSMRSKDGTDAYICVLNNFELKEEDQERLKIPLILDSSSAIAIGNSFRDTKHTSHIMRRFHFVRSMIDRILIIPLWISTKGQSADIGMKVLGPEEYTLMMYGLIKYLWKDQFKRGDRLQDVTQVT
jgi:hypothetical protein